MGGERKAGVEKATYRRTLLRLYHRFAAQSARIALPLKALISHLEASACRMTFNFSTEHVGVTKPV